MRSVHGYILAISVGLGATSSCGADLEFVGAESAPQALGAPAETAVTAPVPDEPTNAVDFYLFGGMTSTEMERFVDERIAPCMASRGHEYVARAFEESEPRTRSALLTYREAHDFGISNPVPPAFDHTSDPNQAILARLTERELLDYIDDLEGAGPKSCRGEAEAALRIAAPAFLLTQTDREALENLYWSSDAINDAHRAYGDCMKASGFPDVDPKLRARSYFLTISSTLAPAKAATLEHKISAADISCEQSELWPAWRTYSEQAMPRVQEIASSRVADAQNALNG